MKILFVVDYYTPFNPGGSEWSVYYLSQELGFKGVDSSILTPNYGSRSSEMLNGVLVERFPFPIKTKNNRMVVNPIWQNNVIFFLWSFIWVLKSIFVNKVDIVHVHGKFMIPGSYIAAKIARKPVIVSVRDKQLLCSFGKCLYEENRVKACGLWEYLTIDLPWFYENYVNNKSSFKLFYVFLAALWTRFANNVIKFFALKTDRVIAISKSQKKYLDNNGFSNVDVIYNSIEEMKVKKKYLRRDILFAGKLSLGKGIFLLLDAIPYVIKKHKELFLLVGSVEQKKIILNRISKLGIRKYVKIIDGMDHFKLQNLYHKVKLVVMPSIFPEAFGRVAMESLFAGTPVVVSNRGGLPEIVKDKFNGVISNITPQELSQAILLCLDKYQVYQENISKSSIHLREKFIIVPIRQHISLYKHLYKHGK